MRFMLLMGLVAFAIVLPAAAAADSGAADASGHARAAIEQANAQFAKEFERGGAAAIAAMYTEDAIVFPPGQEMVKGRQAIEQFWKETMNGGVKSVALTTLDVGVSGDLASEVGTVVLTVAAEGQGPSTVRAKYVVVWQRQAGGSWKLHRDIWNDLPQAK